jgi:hypothetical protein
MEGQPLTISQDRSQGCVVLGLHRELCGGRCGGRIPVPGWRKRARRAAGRAGCDAHNGHGSEGANTGAATHRKDRDDRAALIRGHTSAALASVSAVIRPSPCCGLQGSRGIVTVQETPTPAGPLGQGGRCWNAATPLSEIEDPRTQTPPARSQDRRVRSRSVHTRIGSVDRAPRTSWSTAQSRSAQNTVETRQVC